MNAKLAQSLKDALVKHRDTFIRTGYQSVALEQVALDALPATATAEEKGRALDACRESTAYREVRGDFNLDLMDFSFQMRTYASMLVELLDAEIAKQSTEARAKAVAASGDVSAAIACPSCGGASVRFDPPISLYKPDLEYHCICEQCGERFPLPQAWRDGFWQGVNGE